MTNGITGQIGDLLVFFRLTWDDPPWLLSGSTRECSRWFRHGQMKNGQDRDPMTISFGSGKHIIYIRRFPEMWEPQNGLVILGILTKMDDSGVLLF